MATKSSLDILLHRARIDKFVSIGAVGEAIETIVIAVAFAQRWMKSHLIQALGLSVAFETLYILIDVNQYSIPIVSLELRPTVAILIGNGIGMIIDYAAKCLLTWQVTYGT